MYKNKTFHSLTARLCAEGEQKVLSTFSKVVQSRVKLWSPSAEGETLYYLKRIFAREKAFTNYRIAQIIPEKFPVGSFRQQKPFT